MSDQPSNSETPAFAQPVSVFAGPIAELVGHHLLSPPTRPGLLATLARYEVLRVLGSGGMGVVLLARDGESGQMVALKMVRPELVPDQQVVHRFVKEAGHLQKLKHPSVVPVLEVSDRPQGPYFVMPYFEQGSLAQRIKPGQPLDGASVLDMAIQVAEGLQFAHRRGIIHRDLKPANILLGDGGKTCLADFGLARTMFNDTILDVEREQMEGTAPYMSPGVAQGNAEDTRCDIYSFGALLYEMLTGEPPYAGRNTNDIRGQILAGPPKPIRARNPVADPGVTAVAEGAMGRELRDRYADMTDVLTDLELIKQGRKPTGPHGLVRRVRHFPRVVWIPVAVVLLLLLWMVWPSPPPQRQASPLAPVVVAPTPPVVIQPTILSNPVPPVVVQPTQTVLQTTQVVLPPPWISPMIVGEIGTPGSSDGTGNQAHFSSPSALAVDSAGYVYVADMGNHTIRRISPSGDVRTVAGLAGKSGRIDGDGSNARFTAPSGVAVDDSGNIYVAEFANDTIRKINSEGTVNLLAGSPGTPGWTDAKGDNAHFRNPWSDAVDPKGNVYVSDKDNFVIREISLDGSVTTIAGKPGAAGFADGNRESARFRDPHGIAVDHLGNVYVADTANGAVRKIAASGDVKTVALVPNPTSVAVDAAGVAFVADAMGVHRITNGQTELLPPLALTSDPDGPVAQADSIAVDAKGTIYLADSVKNIICWKKAK